MSKRDIQKLLENYEAMNRPVWSDSSWRLNSHALDMFFNQRAKYQRLDQYGRSDIEDYIKLRILKGLSVSTIKQEVSAIRKFWDWLIDFKEMPLYNPAGQVRPGVWN